MSATEADCKRPRVFGQPAPDLECLEPLRRSKEYGLAGVRTIPRPLACHCGTLPGFCSVTGFLTNDLQPPTTVPKPPPNLCQMARTPGLSRSTAQDGQGPECLRRLLLNPLDWEDQSCNILTRRPRTSGVSRPVHFRYAAILLNAPGAAWRCDDVTMLLEKAVFSRFKAWFLLFPIWRGDDVT